MDSRLRKFEDLSAPQQSQTLTKTLDYEAKNSLSISIERLENKITEEFRANKLKEVALQIKDEHQVVWNDAMNKRKQSYWHSLQNQCKAALYEQWINESPQFLPLKYRPRVNPSDCQETVEQKVKLAEKQYRDDVNLMRHYEEIHAMRVSSADEHIQHILESVDCEETRNLTAKLWNEEVQKNEAISQQLWKKRKAFLVKKKHEDEANGCHQTQTENSVKLKGGTGNTWRL